MHPKILQLFSLILVISCGRGNPDIASVNPEISTPAGQDKSSIINGELSPTLYTDLTEQQQNAIVAVCTHHYCHCSGTLISQHIVLTAAHCVDSFIFELYGEEEYLEVHFGDNYNAPDAVIEASSWHSTHWHHRDAQNDFGIVVLSEINSNVTPIPARLLDGSVADGELTQAVGFGPIQGNTANSLRHWGTVLSHVYATPGVIRIDGDQTFSIAHGDSGGPLLYNFGQGVEVMGVASLDEGDGTYGLVEHHADWIQSFVDHHDNSNCSELCRDIDCGAVGDCVCGACGRAETCLSGKCEQIQGLGGVCVSEQFFAADCSESTDCALDEVCFQDKGKCGKVCQPRPCDGFADSYCFPVYQGADRGRDYFMYRCSQAASDCATDYCETDNGQPGYCMRPDLFSPFQCWAMCEPADNCQIGFGCVPFAVDCSQGCGDNTCGYIHGCDCGSCNQGFECVESKCTSTCTPKCSDSVCGQDGCGGSCGKCAQGENCNDGVCEASFLDLGCQQLSTKSGWLWLVLPVFCCLLGALRRNPLGMTGLTGTKPSRRSKIR